MEIKIKKIKKKILKNNNKTLNKFPESFCEI